MHWGFVLSHHRPEHHHRCVVLLGKPVCARCLGMYPPLVIGGTGMLLLHRNYEALLAPLPYERLVLVGLSLPGVLDWIRGRIRPHAGSNWLRFLTGVLLGGALGRTLYLNARAPLASPALEVMLFLAGAVLVGNLVARAYSDDPGEDGDAG